MSVVTLVQPKLRITTAVQIPGRTTALATREPMLLTFVHAGLRGVQGDPGTGGDYLQFDQAAPATTWTINHNFGVRPNVSAYSTGGRELWAEIIHVSVNQTQILFDSPIAGYAILS